MISVESAITRFRRDLTLGTLIKAVLGGGAVLCLLLRPFLRGGFIDTAIILAGIAVVWMVLSYRSLKSSRIAAGSPMLIANGQFEQAEATIDQALRTFSLYRAVKLLSLHYLAVLRHAQRRWHEAAALSRALLRQRLGGLEHLSKPSRLILADALLEMGDLHGASEAIGGLYQYRLTLGEALNLMSIQLDHQHRVGAWQEMLGGLTPKVQMCELMPTSNAARAQAFLALAAKKTGHDDLSQWLRRRSELLADIQQTAGARPLLWELWEKPEPAKAPELSPSGQAP